MARTLTQIGIETGNVVEAYHVSQSIDAFTGVEAYDISLSGSFNMTGLINGQPGVINPLTASWAITASYAENAGGGAGFPFTGSAQITGSLGLTGSFGINKNISFISGSDLPSAVGATAVYAGGYTTPNIGRLFIGDNTGWQFHFSRISGSIPADIVTIRDRGQVIISNSSASGAFRVDGNYINPAIFSGADLFAGITPKYSLESNLGSSAYNHLLVMRGSTIAETAFTRRNGIVFKMSSESDSNESSKMGAVYLESTEGWSNNPSLCFATYNNERMRINTNGDVGIGKTSPSAKLDVNGNVRVTGSITTPSFITNTMNVTYANNAGNATYANSAGTAPYANDAGTATYANSAGTATTAGNGVTTVTLTGGGGTLSSARYTIVIASYALGSNVGSGYMFITLPNGNIGDVVEIIGNMETDNVTSRGIAVIPPSGNNFRTWGVLHTVNYILKTDKTLTDQPTLKFVRSTSNTWDLVYYMDYQIANDYVNNITSRYTISAS
jgi:hypothetical protein